MRRKRKPKWIAFLLACVLIVGTTGTAVFAAESDNDVSVNSIVGEETEAETLAEEPEIEDETEAAEEVIPEESETEEAAEAEDETEAAEEAIPEESETEEITEAEDDAEPADDEAVTEYGIALLSDTVSDDEISDVSDDEYEITTHAEQLPEAVGGVIELTESIALDETYVVDEGDDITINMNGYTLSLAEGVDGSVIEVINGGVLTLNGGTISGGDGLEVDDSSGAHSEGGGIYVEDSTLTLNNVTVANNYTADYEGGGIYAMGSTLTMDGCTISNNSSIIQESHQNTHENGGGVFAYECYVEISNTTFSNNESNYGGGLEVENCYNVVISHCEFNNNTAYAYGGALHIWAQSEAGVVTVEGCTFTENYAGSFGGAVNLNGTGGETVSFKNCTFEENSTEDYGGGVAVGNTISVTFDHCDFISNAAVSTVTGIGQGGGLYLVNYSGEDTQIIDCTFDGNSSSYAGGGICIYTNNSAAGAFSISDSTIVNNTSYGGGGVYAYLPASDTMNISNTKISGNHADYLGGGIYITQGAFTIDDECVIANNTSDTGAADIAKSSNSSLEFFDAAGMNVVYEADSKGQTIDGWYADTSSARYIPSSEGEAYTEFSLGTGSAHYLIASYGYETDEVLFLPGDHGTLSGDDDYWVKEGTTLAENDDEVPEVTAFAGWMFIGWLGSDGNMYTNEEALALVITEDGFTFTAVYELDTEEYEVIFLPGDHGTLYYNQTDLEEGIEFTVEEGLSVEAVPGVTPDDGYVFDHWEGQSYSAAGIQTYSTGQYQDEDILGLAVYENWVFTAVYEPVAEETEDDSESPSAVTDVETTEQNEDESDTSDDAGNNSDSGSGSSSSDSNSGSSSSGSSSSSSGSSDSSSSSGSSSSSKSHHHSSSGSSDSSSASESDSSAASDSSSGSDGVAEYADSSPATGDATGTALWMILLCCGAAVLAAFGFETRKSRVRR